MGALWQYRWLVLVLLIAPTIAYCQYRAVERLATERCANAGGTWDGESDACTGLPAPQASGSDESDEGEAGNVVERSTDEPAEPMNDSTRAGAAGAAPQSAYDVQYLPSDAASEARIDERIDERLE